MLFTINNDDMLKEYYNLNKSKSDVLSPKEGLILGNMFLNEYDEYKNYKPSELIARTEQEKELLKIRELSFAVNDLNLKLDVEPNNFEYYKLFKLYADKLNEYLKKYSEKYDVLELNYDVNGKYTWLSNPWPWEGNKNV